jgi:2-polyprenyl-3-methyl-5-hydroxy-6-metoxy-1,4-benzoquinol methylase
LDESLYHLHFQHEHSHWWFTSRARIVRQVLEAYADLHRGDTVLDVGCGAGGFLRALADTYRPVGIDTSPLAVEYARRRGLTDVFEMRIEDFPKERYDVRAALLLDVIEHCDDDVAVLRATRRAVTPGGTVLVTVPAYAWLWSAHDVLNHHRRRYTAKTLRASLEAAGLGVQKLTYFNTLLFPLAAVRRLVDRNKDLSAAAAAIDVEPRLVNRLLGAVFTAERHLLSRHDLPFGVSLLAVARA